MSKNKLIFDGIDTSAFDVFIAGEGAYNSPERRGEMVTIPGRNGTLFIDEDSFENIEVKYPAFMGTYDQEVFRTQLRELRSQLGARRTYKRLEDTYHPDEFRLAVFHSAIETEPAFFNRAGELELTFDCKPQRFLKSGEEAFVYLTDGEIVNPTPFASKPLLKVTGNGTITIGDYQVAINGADEPFWIDTEIMETYVPAAEIYNFTDENDVDMTDEHGFILTFADGHVTPRNMLQYVTFKDHEFPKIEPGMQIVEITGLDELIIVPRWWML